ncbi:MAG TPA: hypothetical protein VFS23_01380, partial [Vicinamibacterales bacterium]|nr:hypothetical protein [Vicinamibacterales bacterium]
MPLKGTYHIKQAHSCVQASGAFAHSAREQRRCSTIATDAGGNSARAGVGYGPKEPLMQNR